MPGLGARLGRGGATTFQQSLADSDCIVIMGSNMAENHPVGFRFVMMAKEKGAKLIHIDPRFTRTSALCDIHVPLRAGSDIAFLGGLINYVLNHDRWNSDDFFQTYVRHYTNATAIIDENFRDTEDLGGLFSGYDPDSRSYDTSSWKYSGEGLHSSPVDHESHTGEAHVTGSKDTLSDNSEFDLTMQHPRSVMQILRKHFARYTPDMVAEICGIPKELFIKVAETIIENSGRDKTTAFCYAVAWTQHTTGSQMIGCCAILQLLLGNIGRPGGGILALRGHATIQGSTDIPTLYNLLPGYLPMPSSETDEDQTLSGYIAHYQTQTGWWYNLPKYIISLLKAYYGDNATAQNDYAYDLLPQIGGDYSFEAMIPLMRDGVMRGLFCFGQNPAVGGQNARLARRALASLDWLVVRDVHEIETASFWYASPEVKRGEISPEEIPTEVFLLPAALPPEKDGSFTNTQRLVQWHDKAVDPPDDARSETWFLYHLGRRLKELYADDDSPKGRQISALTWNYSTEGHLQEPKAEDILYEINGYRVEDRKLLEGFEDIKDDGSTACGCWIYCGITPDYGVNRARNRDADDKASLGWGFSWPANRRILYNRASADPQGKPWSERKKWVWWDESQKKWVGYDIPDFPVNKDPSYTPPKDAKGVDAHSGDSPFIMMSDGKGWLFTPKGMKDGPLPTHYEPKESPYPNLLYPDHPVNPCAILFERPDNPYHAIEDPAFPHILTTYRLTEHHTAGGMTRWVPWLAELQPEGFVEISPELAREIGVVTGDWVVLSTARGEIESRVLVTARLQPIVRDGRRIHQIGMPWHFGYGGLARGASANDLSALIEDPNSRIHEAKSFTCNIRKGRLDRR